MTLHLNQATTFAALPQESSESLMKKIQQALLAGNRKVVILDDDPTGTQTVHDVTVITAWSAEVLASALADPEPALFVLTNTRAMTPDRATAVNREIAENLLAASQKTGRSFV